MFVDGVVKGNQKCCLAQWKCIYIKRSVEIKHDLVVISESSITYMVLYSIYWSVSLFFKFAEALKCLCTQRGALNQTEK